jgi:HemY protein
VLTLTIDDYEFRTSAALAAGLLLVIVALLFALVRLAFLLLTGPSKVGAFFGRRRALKAYRALSRGLVAAAAGDAKGADAAAREAETLVDGQPLSLLLKAQAAQLSGDEAREEAAYRAMLAEAETNYLGLRGLSALAERRHDGEQARAFAERAQALNPNQGS